MLNIQKCSGLVLVFCFLVTVSVAQQNIEKFSQEDKFRQLEEILPTANAYRTASGAPGAKYWQQRANYDISVELDDVNQSIRGSETITYFNHSPDPLTYLWVQIDNNIFSPSSDSNLTQTAPAISSLDSRTVKRMLAYETFDGSVKITKVTDASNNRPLKHSIVKTMMRIDLPQPLRTGESTAFSIDWNYKINNARVIGGRTGYEYFPKDKNYIYEMAHWFPRMAAYTDATGWQHKQFLGRGEFTLEFGDYNVKITAPNDHVVAATGVLQNPEDVLTLEQRKRLEAAKDTDKIVFVVTPEEAKANESTQPTGKKTWVFKGDNVRDFAWASSRKFIWDAWEHDCEGNKVMAMSFYPNEGEPLWSRYSTQAIIHTLDVYSRYTFAYPYPTAISVNGPIGGMEYPMICFNGPRPNTDGTYSARTKYGLISVIIHEVGHNYFPMIVNSDERQWTWMDEGLNTFLQFLTEQEWEENYPSRRGEPKNITSYMRSTNQVPIMTNSESIQQFGPNAYAKPATALNILRETILGRELFDFAFKEYARRWKFRRPMPSDLFRTLEDASGIDLDWFWRGWFYSTDHVDLAVTGVRQITIGTGNPEVEKKILKQKRDAEPSTLSEIRNKALPKRTQDYPALKDFYNQYDALDITESDKKAYESYFRSLTDEEKEFIKMKKYFYVIDFENYGGLVMPLIFELKFTNGKSKIYTIPAEIWRRNSEKVSKLVITEEEVQAIVLDPRLETADIDLSNNHFPPKMIQSRFKMFKSSSRSGNSFNQMRQAQMEQRLIESRQKAEKAKAEQAKAEKAKAEQAKAEQAKAKEKSSKQETGKAAKKQGRRSGKKSGKNNRQTQKPKKNEDLN
ncbi:MAG: M1 family aminopeptidase [Planctomycetota bacterium]|nr:M1 family aminopeptidase [Planctomycetota bacterium]